jgi:predicted RNA-binding protein YlqC (UPF0109 family)
MSTEDQAARNGAPFGETGSENNDEADVMSAAMADDRYSESYDEPSEEDARLIELVGFLVQGIVANPDEVEVEEFLDDVGSVYGVRVHPDDVGRVIGREGRVANALRHVVKAAATKTGARVAVEIITEDTPLHVIDDEQTSPASTPANNARGGVVSASGAIDADMSVDMGQAGRESDEEG